MRVVIMGAFLAGLAGIQSVWPAPAWLGQAKAPLVLAGVLYFALTRERGVVLVAGLIGGLLQDALSPMPLGYSSLCLGLIGLAASRFRDLVFREALVTPVVFGGLAGGGAVAALYLLLLRGGLVSNPLWWVLLKALGTAVLAMILTPAVFAVGSLLDRFVGYVSQGRRRADGLEGLF